jgi:hypothetical protein
VHDAVRVHALGTGALIAEACRRLERNLTPDEWTRYVGPGEPYHKTCSNLP